MILHHLQCIYTIIDDDVSVRFTQDQFTGSEATGFVLVNLELTGGTSDSPFDVFVIPSEQSQHLLKVYTCITYCRWENFGGGNFRRTIQVKAIGEEKFGE